MADRIENIQKSFALLPVYENSKERNEERKRFNDNRRQGFQRRRNFADVSAIQHESISVSDNMKLSFSVNKETGETGAIVFNSKENTSRSADFGEVTKASEQVFSRSGIVFDKRG